MSDKPKPDPVKSGHDRGQKIKVATPKLGAATKKARGIATVLAILLIVAIVVSLAPAPADARGTPTPTCWAVSRGGDCPKGKVTSPAVRQPARPHEVYPTLTPRRTPRPTAWPTPAPYRVDPNPCPRPNSPVCGIH